MVDRDKDYASCLLTSVVYSHTSVVTGLLNSQPKSFGLERKNYKNMKLNELKDPDRN